jgi:hypothetical protein
MKILSIDVGIKNLAHCLINTVPLSIEQWDIVDLSAYQTCSCLEKATHELKGLYLCKHHAAYTSLTQCITLCTTHKLPLGTKDEMKRTLKQQTKKITDPTLIDLGKQIIRAYSTMDLPDVVLIENQIGPIASKMKAIQGLLIQYWLMKGVKVECISACNKLKLFHEGKTTYAERKKMSIEVTTQLLERYTLRDHGFHRHKKKDDLADTLLQGIWYIHNCGILKINSS